MPPAEAWLALLYAASTDARAWYKAFSSAGSAEALHALSNRDLRGFGIDAAAVESLRAPDTAVVRRWREWLSAAGRSLVVRDSSEYPKRLAEIPDAPLALWARGEKPELLDAPQVAVVGSRAPTVAGSAAAETFAQYLSACGITVTSGLAAGIDGAAHRGALRACGGTIAVLGCGIDVVYPRSHSKLAEEIAAHGLIVSEYGPGVPARPFRFPQRNRIIAGLGLGTLVVEATRRSGSLITARLANDYGRDVFAVPGSIRNPLSRGCHRLLRDGAKLVEEGGDIVLEIAPSIDPETLPTVTPQSCARAPMPDHPAYAKLVKMLKYEPVTTSELMAGAGLTAAELSSMLVLLELDGHIEALPGGRYCRLAKRS